MMRSLIYRFMATCARAVIKKYHPCIIGITGSVGKTTTKAACVAVLATRFRVRGASKNYNNELGVPFTIFGVDAPGHSPFKWLRVCGAIVRLLMRTDLLYPQALVLELGADHPGDIAHLLSIAPLDVGVVTAVSVAHTEFFGSVDGVLAEKKLVATRLAPHATAILNADDEQLKKIRGDIRARLMLFGFSEDATVRAYAAEIHYDGAGMPDGTEAHLIIEGEDVALLIPHTLGAPVVYAAAAGACVGRALGLSTHEIRTGLAHTHTPPGRMHIIAGAKQSLVIDDTYNSSPRAVEEALCWLARVRTQAHAHGRRIAILGDMLELGALTERVHTDLGARVVKCGVNELVTVGAAARFIADGARAAGMTDEHIFSFGLSVEAADFMRMRIRAGDVILVKGSQGARCEKIVKALMAESEHADELLVRQSAEWD